MIGATLGPYLVERELGRGGMGVVYAARHTSLHQRAAIKVLLPELTGDPALLDRFFAEAQAAAASRHPGIVQILDVSRAGGIAYIVMEFLEGESLAARIARAAPLPVVDVLAITRQLASALSAAHAAGVVHRDLKPDNVHVVPDPDMPLGERTKVLDFGIAKIANGLAGRHGHTRTGVVMGTPSYMSPEQCRGAGAIDHRSDLYALGCIVFEMLTGQPPFPGEVGEVIGAHQYQPPRSVRTLRPDVPRAVDRLVATLLAKAPSDRPASAAALLQTLDELAPRAGLPARVRTGPIATDRGRPHHTTMSAASGEASGPIATPRRWPRVAAVAGLVAIAITTVALTIPGERAGRSAGAAAGFDAGLGADVMSTGADVDAAPTVAAIDPAAAIDAAPVAAMDVDAAPVEVAVASPPDAGQPTAGQRPRTGTSRNDRSARSPGDRTDTPPSPAPAPAPAPTPAPVEEAAAPAPTDLAAIVADAEAKARAGQWEDAMSGAMAALRLDRGDVRATTVAALAACHLGKADTAATLIKRLPATRAASVRSACVQLLHPVTGAGGAPSAETPPAGATP